MTTCRWFALCENDAVGVVSHPVLGDVPTCRRCVNKLGLVLHEFPSTSACTCGDAMRPGAYDPNCPIDGTSDASTS